MRKLLVYPLLVVFGAVSTQLHAMQQAFLVQNSGWMEPFYVDSTSQFKPLVAAVAAALWLLPAAGLLIAWLLEIS